MNDFTKQELECLHYNINKEVRDIPMSENNLKHRLVLLGKLKSMIENLDCDNCSRTKGDNE